MIDVIKRTPEEYSKQSRDYQVLARLYSALFNVSKMYIDDMNIWDKNIDNKLSLLRARTLNFDPQHDWDLDSLDVIVSEKDNLWDDWLFGTVLIFDFIF